MKITCAVQLKSILSKCYSLVLVTSYQLSDLHKKLTYFQKAKQVTEPKNKIHALIAFSPCLNYLSPKSTYLFLIDNSCHNGKKQIKPSIPESAQ